jgi:hypothetical protein
MAYIALKIIRQEHIPVRDCMVQQQRKLKRCFSALTFEARSYPGGFHVLSQWRNHHFALRVSP